MIQIELERTAAARRVAKALGAALGFGKRRPHRALQLGIEEIVKRFHDGVSVAKLASRERVEKRVIEDCIRWVLIYQGVQL